MYGAEQKLLTTQVEFKVHTSPRGITVSEQFAARKRDWREIAAEAFAEKDPKRLEQLAEELAKALDERDRIRAQKSA